jgi:UDP-3-O-[3-hydroxymyristoyl] glucosamine N-acyltransferase
VTRVRLGEIVDALGATLVGDPELIIQRIAPLDQADAGSITFLAHARYRSQLGATAAAAVIVAEPLADAAPAGCARVLVPDPYLSYARLSQWWAARVRLRPPPGRHPSAWVDPAARLADDVSVGPMAVIGAAAVLEAGVEVGAHAVVGAGVHLGAGTRLAPRVTVLDGCRIGARTLLHPGVVIGADGFGFAPEHGTWTKIEQLGAVVIGDDVEIGANTCIDRGALGDTVIGNGVKLDNLIQVGHNVHIGDHTAMAGCVGIAGSARIGAHCTVGGGAIILGHLEIVDRVNVSAATVVTRSILKPGHYSGVFPFDENAAWEKNAATLRQLHALRDRLRALEKKP